MPCPASSNSSKSYLLTACPTNYYAKDGSNTILPMIGSPDMRMMVENQNRDRNSCTTTSTTSTTSTTISNMSIAETSDRLHKTSRKLPPKSYSGTTSMSSSTENSSDLITTTAEPTSPLASTVDLYEDYDNENQQNHLIDDNSALSQFRDSGSWYSSKSPDIMKTRKVKRTMFRASETGKEFVFPAVTPLTAQSGDEEFTYYGNRNRTSSFPTRKPKNISEGRSLTDSIISAFSSSSKSPNGSHTNNDFSTGRLRSRSSNDEIPLHMNNIHKEDSNLSKTSFLRSRRSRNSSSTAGTMASASSYENTTVDGYQAVDGRNNNTTSERFTAPSLSTFQMLMRWNGSANGCGNGNGNTISNSTCNWFQTTQLLWGRGFSTTGTHSEKGNSSTAIGYDLSTTASKHKKSYEKEYILPLVSAPMRPMGSSSPTTTRGSHTKRQQFMNQHCLTTMSESSPGFGSTWFQTLIVITATCLVWHAYHKTQTIQDRLELFHDKESLSLLHLKTVEQHLIQLHESVGRFTNAFSSAQSNNSLITNGSLSNQQLTSNVADTYGSRQVQQQQQLGLPAIDIDLIREQTQQLYQMEEELDHEVRGLQHKIQQVARSSIVAAYGEGPVQVVLELDFGGPTPAHDHSENLNSNDHRNPNDVAGDFYSKNGISSLHVDTSTNVDDNYSSTISILLWYDTPHAAWTWLQQIRNGRWINASFEFAKGSLSIDARPLPLSPIETSKDTFDEDDNTKSPDRLKFIERSKKTHEPWTVGLNEDENGTLKMFINLQDNSATKKHDVCVGKIIDGFDVLQRLVDTTRRIQVSSSGSVGSGSNKYENRNINDTNGSGIQKVSIKKAYATHLTRVQAQGLVL